MMKKYVLSGAKSPFLISLFLLLLSIGVFGQATTTYDFSASGAVTGLNANPPIAVDSNIGFASFRNSSGTNPAIFSGQLRLYQNATKGGSIKIYAQNGVTITKVVVYASGGDGDGPAGYSVDNTTEAGIFPDGTTTYTINGIAATDYVEFYNKGTSSNTRTYVDKFEVTYTSGCSSANVTTNPTNQSTTTAGTATFTVAGTGTVQWQENTGSGWNNLSNSGVYSGVTSNNLVITNPAIGMDGYQYRAVLSQSCDSTTDTSNAATLEVTPYVGPCLSEDFSSGDLPSGWTRSSTSITFGSYYADMSVNTGTLTTLAVSRPNQLKFDLSRTNNTTDKNLNIEISTTSPTNGFSVVTNYDHNNTISNGTTACTVDLSAYSSDTTVYIRFNKTSGNTSPWRIDNVQVFCAPACEAPTVALQTTSVNNITTTSARLYGNVTAPGGATLNTRGFEYSTSSALSSPTPVNESATATGNYDLATGTLVPNTVYYYRAYAVNDCATPQTGYSHTSGYPTFTTIHNAPNVGTGSAPTSHGFTANWSAPSGTVGSANFTYEIQVSTDNTFATVDFTQDNIASTSTSLVINDSALNSSTTYYYRVRANNAGGSSAWSAVSAGIMTDVATFTSIKNGDWNTANTWDLNSVPGQNDKVIINHIVSTATGITRNASTTVNGTFQLNSGGYVTGGSTKFTYNQTTGTLNFKTNGIYDVNNNDAYWPVTDGPINVNVLREATDATGSDSGFRLNSANRTIPTNGTLSISGYNGTNYTGIFLNSSTLYINGKISIKPFGFVGNTPVYGNASTLEYNNVSSFTVGNEWTANSTTAGAGVPQNVSLVNNASINMPTGNRGIAGNLTIASGSTLTLNGSNGDLYIAGNWNNGGTFNPNSRAVFFNGSTNQTINGTTAFDYLFINNANNVTLASSISINNNTNSRIDFINGKLILGANNLTLDGNAYVAGANASRYIVTNGAGQLKRTVATSQVEFPIGSTTNYNPIKVTNTGTSDVYGFRLIEGTFTPVNDATKIVNDRWVITEAVSGGSTLNVIPQWNTANQASGFAAATDPYIGFYNGTSWVQESAAIAGTNPYTATSASNFSPTNLTTGTQYFAVGKDNGLTLLPCTAPIAQPTGLTFGTVTATSISGSFTAASPAANKYLVVISTNATLSATPVNGTAYTAGNPLGGGTVVQASSATTFTASGLIRSTPYYFFIFSYNDTCTGEPYYLTTAPLTGSVTTLDSSPIWVENFDYGCVSNNDILATSANTYWSPNSPTNYDDFRYNSGGLQYSGYASSGIGGAIEYRRTEDEDIKRTFSDDGVLSGSVYMSFLINLNSDTSTSSNYFATFMGTSSSAFYGRIYSIKGTTNYQLGLNKYNGTTQFSSNLNFDTTYLVIVKYEIVDGGNNDIFKMWIVPSGVPTSEAAAGTANVTAQTSDTDFSLTTSNLIIKNVLLRQDGTSGLLDGLRVGTTWEDVVSAGGSTVIPDTYTWNGSISSDWDTACNWTPTGVPRATDNVIINTSVPAVSNNLNLTSTAVVKDFTLNNTGNFSMSSTGILTITGDVTYADTATASLDCNSQINITSPNEQTIPTLTYGNLDILGGNRIFSPTGTIKICSAFTVNPALYSYTVTGSTVEYISPDTGWNMTPFTYNNLIFSGSGTFNLGNTSGNIVNVLGNYSQSAGTVYIANAGRSATINIDGNMTVSGGTLNVKTANGTGTGTVNLKGNLDVEGTVTAVTSGTKNFNFTGTTQSINYAGATKPAYISFNVKGGSTVQLINQDLALDTNSIFTIESGGTLDFGFDGNTALNIVRRFTAPSSYASGQKFELKDGGNLKITSPEGITTFGNYIGNVQIGATNETNRIFVTNATYHYIGKKANTSTTNTSANQVSGNGLPTVTGKVIVELDDNTAAFYASGNKTIDSGGLLDIKKGLVIDDSSNSFSGAGALTMNTDDGAKYRISKTGIQPALTGNYTLTKGVIEFANSQTTDQTVRNETYQNIEITGTNVGNSNGNILLHNNGTFKVKNTGANSGGIFTINQYSIKAENDDENNVVVTVEDKAVFKTGNDMGFSGYAPSPPPPFSYSAIHGNINNINLMNGSTVEYSREGDQLISAQTNVGQGSANYANLNISGSGIKAPADNLEVNDKITVNAGELKIKSTQDNITSTDHHVPNVLWAHKGIINNGGIVTLENNAQLMQDDSGVTNSGMVDVQRKNTIPSSTFAQYVYWSSPVVPASNEVDKFFTKIFSGYTAAATYYSETNDHFYASSGKYIVGRGLAVKNPVYGTSPSPNFVMAELKGTPFNGPATFSMTMTGRGFNLVGNPYPTNLSLQELYLLNGGDATATSEGGTIDPTFHLWDNVNNPDDVQEGSAYGGASYAIFNAKGTGTFTPANSSIKTFDGAVVSIGQGFMVKAIKADNKILMFNNTVRKPEKGAFFKSALNNIDLGKYWLRLTNASSGFSTIAVTYSQGASNALESFDSKVANRGGDMFYSYVDDNKLAIQGRAYDFITSDVVPLGTAHSQEGNYTISVWKKEGIFEGQQQIYLRDKTLGTVTDISEGSYSFQSTAGEFNNRFEIIYEPQTTLGTTGATKGDIIVYRDGNDFVIKSSRVNIQGVELYEVSGKLTRGLNGNAKELRFPTSKLANGVYILKIRLENGSVVTRKIIR